MTKSSTQIRKPTCRFTTRSNRDSHRWGDTSGTIATMRIPESVFDTRVAAHVPVFDVRAERVQLGNALKQGPVVLIGQLAMAVVLLPKDASLQFRHMHIEGLDASGCNGTGCS